MLLEKCETEKAVKERMRYHLRQCINECGATEDILICDYDTLQEKEIRSFNKLKLNNIHSAKKVKGDNFVYVEYKNGKKEYWYFLCENKNMEEAI